MDYRDDDERRIRHSSSRDRGRSRHRSRSPSRERKERHSSRTHSRDKEKRRKKHSKRHDKSNEEDYHDSHDQSLLSKKFVWKKKIEQDEARGISRDEQNRRDRERREEAERELEKLRKRREQREMQQKEREHEQARMRREREQETLGDWERREEEFHLEQAKRRAEIKIQSGRPRAIDMWTIALRLANEDIRDDEVRRLSSCNVDIEEPMEMIRGMREEELHGLRGDVEMFVSLEINKRNLEFWQNMLVAVDGELNAVEGESEIRQVLANKSLRELDELNADVEAKLSGGQGAVDVDYWERVRTELAVERARVQLAESYADAIKRGRERIRRIKGDKAADYGAGRGRGSEIEQRKRQQLEELQRRIEREKAQEADNIMVTREEELLTQNIHDVDHDEESTESMFTGEAQLPARKYAWQDKHRPRKPRYFNRVHTGYEWNKYNQTHYDKDNPPPKVVQGYKFNIFYPELIDRSQAPTYKVEKDPESDETVVLRFMAGPPYEDVAFRIVNREWELNRQRGFRNVFDRGVLQLHFRFKRHRYRR
ncbi:hypothetical protein LPJ78_000840 [Coemansia sp. RSA 989]|nr:hypothetical protein LPJ78_000840 [Coemansia sp. RSA 989]